MDTPETPPNEENSAPSSPPAAAPPTAVPPQWKPLTVKQRRVLGTLMEKSKTTPDAYPMTFAGLTTGCNQKSNREPITHFTADQVEGIVDELRELGAVTIVQGSGRVTKVRHYAYNWMELNKIEAAVMTELLLRGEQTIAELRTRASRMEPIADLSQMQQLFDALKQRNLVVELTPPGRGQLVTHNLYPEWELDQLRERVATKGGSAAFETADSTPSSRDESSRHASNPGAASQELVQELASLKEVVAKLSDRLAFIESELGIK